MEKLTLNDLREAIAYVTKSDSAHARVSVRNVPDEELVKYDFSKDLHMGNIRVYNVLVQLQQHHGLNLPLDVFLNMKDNTVGAMLAAVNAQLD